MDELKKKTIHNQGHHSKYNQDRHTTAGNGSQHNHAEMGHEKGDHNAQVDHTGHEEMFRRKFWVSLILSIPVLVFSPSIQRFLGYSLPEFLGSQ